MGGIVINIACDVGGKICKSFDMMLVKYVGFFLVMAMIKTSNHTKTTNMLGKIPKRNGHNGFEYNPMSGLGILLYTKYPNIQQNNTSTSTSLNFTFISSMMPCLFLKVEF